MGLHTFARQLEEQAGLNISVKTGLKRLVQPQTDCYCI